MAACVTVVHAASPNVKVKNFARCFILKLTGVTDAELELAGATVELIMVNRDAGVQPQRAEFGKCQAQAEAPVVVVIAKKPKRLRRNGADVVKRRDPHAQSVVFFKDGNAVF